MTYKPPVFATFRVNSLNLSAKLGTKLGRFELVADNKDADKKSNELELLIARINQLLKCNTKRDTAKDVFELLVNELRPVLKENDEEKEKDAFMLLLGALLHRYFRIINECKARYVNVLWKQKPEDSGLFMAIREALRLPEKKDSKYLEADLEVLDTTTIITCLEFFRDNMLENNKEGEPKYKQYPHFEKDPNFVYYLNEIIKQHKPESEFIINQFKAINFIRSLAKQLETQRLEMEDCLDSWAIELKRCSSVALTKDLLETHLDKHLKDADLKENIMDLLDTQAIKKHLATPELSTDTFIEKMKVCHSETASYILLGGYSVVLQSITETHQLQFSLYEALGIEKTPDVLTENDKYAGIVFLKKYLEENEAIKLNYEYFGGRKKLETAIVQNEENLLKIISKKAPKSNSVEQEKTESVSLGMT